MILSISSDFGTLLVGIFSWRAIACKFISVFGLRDSGNFSRSSTVQIEFRVSAIAVGAAVFAIFRYVCVGVGICVYCTGMCICDWCVCTRYMCVAGGWVLCCGGPSQSRHSLVGHLAQFLVVFPYDEQIREFSDISVKGCITYLILLLEQVL